MKLYGKSRLRATALALLGLLLAPLWMPNRGFSETTNERAQRLVDEKLYNRKALPTSLLENKKEGWYFTFLPAIASDPETGFNFGAIAEIYFNKSKDDPLFKITPYRQKISVGAVITSRNWQSYTIEYDLPYIMETPMRLRMILQGWINPVATYFGVGEDSMQALTFTGAGQTFDTFDEFRAALAVASGGTALTRYHEFKRNNISFRPTLEYDLLGGIFRPMLGFDFGYYWIRDYTGTTVRAVDSMGNETTATQGPTKLAEDCGSAAVIGCGGGWDNYIKVGLTFDTRDFEPDPTNGLLFQQTSEFSLRALGSLQDYQRFTFSFAGYHNLLSDPERLIIAGRFLYSMQFGDVPFYALPYLAYSNERNREGLGGFRSLRGFVQNRFVGPAAILNNWEVRWSFADANVWSQHLRFALTPFYESGRIFDSVTDTNFNNWKHAFGVGLRLTWNLSTVILFDYGVSSESDAFYMELGYTF